MRLVFAGTPNVAVPALLALAATDHTVEQVITRADAALGRKRVLTPSPLAQAAADLGLPVLKTNRLDAAVTAQITALQPDLGVIVAYGGLVREPLLSVPRLGWINLHFSLLPRWRGASPVQRAVIAGEAETGAAVFQLVPELDAGAVFGQIRHRIDADDTSGSLLETLSHSGADLLLRVIEELSAGTAQALPQTGAVTLAPKLTLDDARIDWTRPATVVYSRVRGVTPEPGAFTSIDGARLKIHRLAPVNRRADDDALPALAAGTITEHDRKVLVGTGTEPLELLSVQPAGKTTMRAIDWWRGVAATEMVAS
ncbi:MAG: methionyl-tRNA formyltransferase [Cryobacterium sp.]